MTHSPFAKDDPSRKVIFCLFIPSLIIDFLLIPSISMHFCESSALLVGKSFKRQLQNNSLLCEYLTLYQAVLHLLIKARKAPTSNQRLMLISTFFYFYLITIQRPSRLPPILSITPFSCKLAKDLSTVLFSNTTFFSNLSSSIIRWYQNMPQHLLVRRFQTAILSNIPPLFGGLY